MTTPAICVDRLGLSFAGKILFKDLSFSVDQASCTCLLGPSGCGKSTLLKIISGNTALHWNGTVECAGVKVGKGEYHTAWMAQEDLLLPWLDVLGTVLLGAKLRNQVTTALKDKATRLLTQAGLGDTLQALPATLSGGMRQRVALLRTLMEEREILLMDEPFSALDALTRLTLQNLSSQLTSGATVLLVTHDPMEALRMGNRILLLGGEPVQIQADIILQGVPPRPVDDSEIVERYPQLLELLMQGSVQ